MKYLAAALVLLACVVLPVAASSWIDPFTTDTHAYYNNTTPAATGGFYWPGSPYNPGGVLNASRFTTTGQTAMYNGAQFNGTFNLTFTYTPKQTYSSSINGGLIFMSQAIDTGSLISGNKMAVYCVNISTGDTISLQQIIGGSNTAVNSTAAQFNANQNYIITVLVNTSYADINRITVYLDHVLVISSDDATYSGGYVGPYNFRGVKFYDDLSFEEAPLANFTANTTNGTEPLAVAFTDTTTNHPDAWLWDFGDGNTSTSQNPVFIYNIPDTYTVTLTATNTATSNKTVKTDYITVSEAGGAPVLPIPAFSANDTAGDAPHAVLFADASIGPVSWNWSFGDGNVSALQNPVHTYTFAGLFDVNLTVTNASGTNSTVKSSYINVSIAPGAPVVAGFTANATTVYIGGSVQFTDTSTESPDNWDWYYNMGGADTKFSDAQNPKVNAVAAGVLDIMLYASRGGIGDWENKTGYLTIIDPATVCNFTVDDSAGDVWHTATFTDTSTATTASAWYWMFGDGNTSAAEDPVFVYKIPGLYSVNHSVTNATGTAWHNVSSLMNITTAPVSPPVPPTCSFTGTPLDGTDPLSVQFTDASTVTTPLAWSWLFGDGNTSAAQSPLYTYHVPGLFTVNHSVMNASGTAWQNRTAYVNVRNTPPAVSFTGSNLSGAGPLVVKFTDTTAGLNISAWYYDFGDGNTSVLEEPEHIYEPIGTFTVRHSATNDGGRTWQNRTNYITVTGPPAAVLIVTNPATDLSDHTATMNGEVFVDNWTRFEYGSISGSYPLATEWLPTAIGTFEYYLIGTPILPNHTYYFRACMNESICGDEESFTVTAITPIPTETFTEEYYAPFYAAHWNITQLAIVVPTAYTNIIGQATWGLFFFTVLGMIWLRTERATLVAWLYIILSLGGVLSGMIPPGWTMFVGASIMVILGGISYYIYRGPRGET